MSLEGKVALVTGAGHGIGEATAKLLAVRGAVVVVNDRQDSCFRVAKEIESSGGRALAVQADVTDVDSVRSMVERAVKEFGRLDILVNNAGWWGVPRNQPIESVKFEDWSKVLDINLNGQFHCTRFAVPHMKRQGYGKIVNVGSGAGVVWSRTGIHAYAASKAAVGGLTRQLAKELAGFGINVNCVAPGLVNSYPERTRSLEEMSPDERVEQLKTLESIPAGRIGTPKDIAEVIVFLASDAAGYVHGQTLLVDGGHWMK